MDDDDGLDNPYVALVRDQVRAHWAGLSTGYRQRTGQAVPLLTSEDVAQLAASSEGPRGENVWLDAALRVAGSFRPDLRPDVFRQLVGLVARENPALQLRPQPIEILVAIEAIRPPAGPGSPRATTHIQPSRKRGRPRWARETFLDHYAEAQQDAAKHGDDPTRLPHVAKYFKNLSGERDVDIWWLRKLKARFLPE